MEFYNKFHGCGFAGVVPVKENTSGIGDPELGTSSREEDQATGGIPKRC